MNKKGWIRILEAFMAILLIAGILLVVMQKFLVGPDIGKDIYEREIAILRKVELNSTLRDEIFEVDYKNLPVQWDGFEEAGLKEVKNLIKSEIPIYLNCEAELCKEDSLCVFDKDIDEDVYAKSIILSANGDTFSPRKLKLFCWPV